MAGWGNLIRLTVILVALYAAVRIRLNAVINYGMVIHEFDPWFNFRAAEYMVNNGYQKFQAWYDEEVWYPLGRHVGSTTYPGLQLTAWGMHSLLARIYPMSLTDICVLMPAGFGAIASIFTSLLAYEATRSANAAVAALAIMAIIPAHLMRSVAGGFDNESVAISAIVGTFYFWVRSLRSEKSWPFAVLCGSMYVYLVASWGGYVFALNLIGVHAGMLVLIGRFTPTLWRAYSIWFVIGTTGAVFGPARYLVGWQPFQSLEQLGPTAVFCFLQVWQFTAVMAKSRGLNGTETFMLRCKTFALAALVASIAAATLLPEGFVGPLSARVRGLFIKHTKTGNPLVDSVAEHQATPPHVYWSYFHCVCFLGPPGCVLMLHKLNDAKVFIIIYCLISYYFSGKMIRLVLLLGPAAAVAAAATVSFAISFTHEAWTADDPSETDKTPKKSAKSAPPPSKAGKAAKRPPGAKAAGASSALPSLTDEILEFYNEQVPLRRGVGLAFLVLLSLLLLRFWGHSWALSPQLSEPQILMRGRTKEGNPMIIDDYRESYFWLKDHTPQDARVMSWWDYGYQINGVGNRTTIADGNTWNHEHIALLGKCLVSAENTSWPITRHLADYVLIWTGRYIGMYSDDLAKSPHMARIAGSVYPDINPNEFYMNRDAKQSPSKMMKESLLWRLHHHRFHELDPPLTHFEEVFTSKNKMVRIYKVLGVSRKSKEWRVDNGPGYPPELKQIIAASTPFKQIHGF